jgi:hypothetical protein
VGGKPTALADVKELRGLAGSVYRSGGEAQATAGRFLEQRDNAATVRLNRDINDYVSGGPTSYEATKALLNSRSAAARPRYEALDNVDYVWSSRLQEFFRHPDIMRGMKRGYELERRDALSENRPFDPTMLGIDFDIDGNILFRRTPNMRVIDMAKRGLDDMISKERNEITGRLSTEGVSLDKMRRSYLDEVDSLDTKGLYKKARDAWAGPSASLDAVRLGRSAFGSSPEENAAAFAALSENDKEFYRIGLADMLKEKLLKAGFTGDEGKALIKNEWTRRQMRPAFRSEEDFNRFTQAVERETEMFGTMRSITGGSQTAERVSEDVRNERAFAAGRAALGLATGHWLSSLRDFYRLHRDLGLMPNEELNAEIAKILFAPSSPQNRRAQSILFRPPQTKPTGPTTTFQDVLAPAGAAAAPGGVIRYDEQGQPREGGK